MIDSEHYIETLLNEKEENEDEKPTKIPVSNI